MPPCIDPNSPAHRRASRSLEPTYTLYWPPLRASTKCNTDPPSMPNSVADLSSALSSAIDDKRWWRKESQGHSTKSKSQRHCKIKHSLSHLLSTKDQTLLGRWTSLFLFNTFFDPSNLQVRGISNLQWSYLVWGFNIEFDLDGYEQWTQLWNMYSLPCQSMSTRWAISTTELCTYLDFDEHLLNWSIRTTRVSTINALVRRPTLNQLFRIWLFV